MAERYLRISLAILLVSPSAALGQRVAPPTLHRVSHDLVLPIRTDRALDATARALQMARETAPLALADSRSSRWSTVRSFLFLETAIAALSSLRYVDESGTETLGGVLVFAGVFGYMGLTEGPCAATTPGVLQLIPAALVLVGGYDVFMGSKRDPTARDVFWTNEVALNVIVVSGLLMSRNAPGLSPPCR